MKTIFPTPNRLLLQFGDAPHEIHTMPITQGAIDTFNAFFLSDFAMGAFCPQSFLLQVDEKGATVYAGGDAGAAYATLALSQLAENGRLPQCHIVYIPHQKKRQVVLRTPAAHELPLFLRLVDQIGALKYNSLYFADAQSSDLSILQRQQLAAHCDALGIAENLLDAASVTEAGFELDAASVVGFSLRTRYEYSDVIGETKVSYREAYDVNALVDSGFLFRLTIGALAMNQPDFGNDYWDKALEASMAHCYNLTRALTNAPGLHSDQAYALVDNPMQYGAGTHALCDIPDGCDALCIRHAATGFPSGTSALGRYVLTFADGTAQEMPLTAGHTIGPIDADWSHQYDPVTHTFATDKRLQTVCCFTQPQPAWGEAAPATYYALLLHVPGKQIRQLSLSLDPGAAIILREVTAHDAPPTE